VGLDIANNCPVGLDVADGLLTVAGAAFAGASYLGAKAPALFAQGAWQTTEFETGSQLGNLVRYGFTYPAPAVGAAAPNATLGAQC
jgi:hypothetical protein